MLITSVAPKLPPHRFEQDELIAALKGHWAKAHVNLARLEQLHRSVQVGARHLALSRAEYERLGSFTEANDAFIRVGTELAEAAAREALAEAGLAPADVDAVFFTTVTGLAVPTIDARLVNRLRLRPDVKRVPLFGLGCVAGAAGLARVYDYLRAWPEHVAMLVSVELCSLTMQAGDVSVPNLIATGLFGDGAAAVVCVGDARGRELARPRPQVVATRSAFFYDTERVMGWDVGQSGFKVVLAASVPEFAGTRLAPVVDAFLAEHGLARRDVRSWVCHPGGPKVLEALADGLGLGADALALSWRSLREVGNLSSASVLMVLADTLRERPGGPGEMGLVMALGPGFCAELVLFRW
jgi:alkylresorcinol/alkylpyrone synthase